MNEEQLQIIANLVYSLEQKGLSTEAIQAEIDKKKVEFKGLDEELSKIDDPNKALTAKTTPVSPDATAGEATASDSESVSADGSLDSLDIPIWDGQGWESNSKALKDKVNPYSKESYDETVLGKPKPVKKPSNWINYSEGEKDVWSKTRKTPEDYFTIEEPAPFDVEGTEPIIKKLDGNQMQDIVDTTRGVYESILLSPKNFNLPFPSHSESANYNYEPEDITLFQDKAYEVVKEKTGLNISKDDFLELYSQDGFDNIKRQTASNQLITKNQLTSSSETVDPKFRDEQMNILYNSKTNKEQAKINQVSRIREAGENITKTNSQIQALDSEDEDYDSKLEALNIQLADQEGIIKDANEIIDTNATSRETRLSVGGGMNPSQSYKVVDSELKSSFLNRGYTQSSIDRILKSRKDVKNTASVETGLLQREDPSLTDEQALTQYFNSQLQRKQNLIKEDAGKIITLKQSKLDKNSSAGENIWFSKLKSNGHFPDENGEFKVSVNRLKQLGLSPRSYQGALSTLDKFMNEEDVNYLKMSNDALDDVDGDLLGLYELVYQNTDPAVIKKPGFLKNIAQNAMIGTAIELGATPEAAENIATLGYDKRNRFVLDRIEEVTAEYNSSNPSSAIKFTKEQEDNLARTFMENVEEGTGQMAPVIGKIMAITSVTGGAVNLIKGSKWMYEALKGGSGFAKGMANILKSKGFGLALEEANMQFAGFEPGTGLTFGVGRMLAKPLTFTALSGNRLPFLNSLFEKTVKAGVIGSLSSEAAAVAGLGYEDLMDTKDFSSEFKASYGDLSEVTQRLLVNAMVFGIAGVQGIKKTDFMTSGAKLKAIGEMFGKQQDILGNELIEVTNPDGSRSARRKTYEDLTSKEKEKYDSLDEGMLKLDQLFVAETGLGELDVKNPEFESLFNTRYKEPMTKAIQSVIPEFKGFNVKFGEGKDFRKKYFSENDNTAEWDPETKTMYFDKDKYNSGKPLHEFTHVAMGAYFDAFPKAKLKFKNKMQDLFKDFEIGDYEGVEFMDKILESYGKLNKKTGKYEMDENLSAEEYLANMVEILSNPKVYYSKVAPNFVKEVIAEVNDVLIETGMKKFAPKPTNAKEFIELIASLGRSAGRGTKFEVKASVLAQLEKIDFLGLEYVDTKEGVKNAKQQTKAAKDLFQRTDKVFNETKELFQESDKKSQLYKDWVNEIERRLKDIKLPEGEKIEIAKTFINGKRGLRGLVKEFDQTKLDKTGEFTSLSAYLNNKGKSKTLAPLINRRLIEFYENNPRYKNILKSISDEGFKELSGDLGATISRTETAFNEKSGNIVLEKKLGVETEVNSIMKDIEIKDFEGENYKTTINRLESVVDEVLTHQFISQPVNAIMLHNALPKSIMSGGTATGIGKSILKDFYTKSDIRTKSSNKRSKAGLGEQFKQPFNKEVWDNFIKRRTNPDGTKERINDQLNKRINALKQEIGKAMTVQSKVEILKKELKGNPHLESIIKFVTNGKSPMLASKLLKPAKKFMERLAKLNTFKEKERLFLNQPKELREGLDGIMLSANEKDIVSYLNKLSKEQVLLETLALEKYAKDYDVTLEQAKKELVEGESKWKPVRKNIGLSEGGRKNITNRKRVKASNKQFIKDMIPEGMTFKELPKNMQQLIIDTIGFGDTRFTQQGRPLTYKEYKTSRDYSKLLTEVYGKDILNGTGKKLKNELGEDIDLNSIYGPRNWGKKGISDKIKEIVSKKGITPISARKQVEELLSAKNFTIDQTLDANVALLKSAYQSLTDRIIKKPTKQVLEDVIDLMEAQVNRATSIFKGAVPMRSFNMKPEQSVKGKNRIKVLHNEHLRELFQANKDVVMQMNSFRTGRINAKTLKKRVSKIVSELEQANISERMREAKDKTGASKRDFYDLLTFLGKDAINQIPIGSFRKGNNMAEAIVNSLKLKEKVIILKTPSSKLNSEGIQVKQRLSNPKDYARIKSNNIELAEKAGVKDSKELNQGEVFKGIREIDINNSKEIKKRYASKDLDKEFNEIIEESSGVNKDKKFSDIRARTVGNKKRKWQLFIPDSAADLNGLLDVTLTKGKKGDAQRKWYKENIIDPFNVAEEALIRDRVALTSGFKGLKKQLKIVPKDLRKEALDGFTYEQAIRVHTWSKQGMEVEGLSKRDLKDLNSIIEKNPELVAFSDQLIELGKGEGYPAPIKEWLAGSIATDLRTGLNKNGRAKYLEATGYTENVNKIYSKENLNKVEAVYGTKYRVALENMLGRMKSGVNRKPSANAMENRALDWINNANGVTMFLNARSAVLQTISAVNYINWTDNNPLKAGKALANQPQYWKDFMEIMNSDYLVDRRNGLKLNVSESEIADAAKSSSNGPKGAINYLLSKGFIFTRIADSFAIASGGSTFYRNRMETYKKQGLSEKEAKAKAFKDFREISEESQQSANVSKISMEQSSSLGRLVLAFANTPMQYARLQKRAVLDLANGRGDYKTNLSKVAYYGVIQNFMFNALQNALFTNIWEDEPDEKKEDMKNARIANGMLDSILRGMGIGGAGVSTMKNILLKIKSEGEKTRPQYENAALEVFDFLPPIDSKIRKLRNAGSSLTWDAKEMKTMSLMDVDNPAYLAGANVISAATNFPADRIIKKVTNMNGIITDDMEMWQRVTRFAGWSEWEIGPQKPKKKKSGFTTKFKSGYTKKFKTSF